LIAAANRCHRIAIASRSPDTMLSELQKAIELLEVETPMRVSSDTPPKSPPVLRVIQGGLSRA